MELLNGGLGDDIALHVDVRHDLGHVVRNSRLVRRTQRAVVNTGPKPVTTGCKVAEAMINIAC